MGTESHSPAASLRVIEGDGVWIDIHALDELKQAAALAGCVQAVGMPDLHAGGGFPIGAALAFADRLHPRLIGSDAGCGARLVVTTLRRPALDKVERSLRAAFAPEQALPWESDEDWLGALASEGLLGLSRLESCPQSLRRLLEREPSEAPFDLAPIEELGLSPSSPLSRMSLGSIGGGNHFAEVVWVKRIVLPEVAQAWGLESNRLAVLVHSGSRGFGKQLADRFGTNSLAVSEAEPFLKAQAWACRYARANRFLLAWRVLSALGVARPDKLCFATDCTHNEVVPLQSSGQTLWLHRKGAAPAVANQPTLLLGSRGASSWLLLGEGNPESLESVAHGAGRRMSRSEALSKMKSKYRRESLARTPLGGRVICDKTELLFEEHPDAYKAIEPALQAIEAAHVARPVAELEPLVTVKQ